MGLDLSFVRLMKPYTYAEQTHVGLVREQNEDSLASYPDLGLFVVADGMGGLSHGEVASRIATDTIGLIIEKYDGEWADSSAREDCMREAFDTAHHRIVGCGKSMWPGKKVGTIGVALWLAGSKGIVCHVGDSRLYRWREKALEQITKDHTMVQELVDMGRLTPEEAETSPYAHKLTRALGIERSHEPETRIIDVQTKDVFLLCSDGLYGLVGEDVLHDALQAVTRNTIKEQAVFLKDEALKRGGHDNISLILVIINKT